MQETVSIKTLAFKWFTLGISVLATHKEMRKGKLCYIPFIAWVEYQNRLMTELEFNSQRWDKADGFSLILGKLPSGKYLTLFDFDNHDKEFWKDKDFEDCLSYCEKSPHGYHILFLSEKEPVENKNYSELELLCSERICNMYPDHVLKDLPLMVVQDANVNFDARVQRFKLVPKRQRKEFDTVSKLLVTGVSEGERDSTAIIIASKLRVLGKTKEQVLSDLSEWNKLNTPPLDEKTISEKVESAFKTPVPYFNSGKEKCDAKILLRSQVFQNLIKSFKFVCQPNNILYVYQDGIYQKDGIAEQLVKAECVKVFGESYSKGDYEQILDRIKGSFPVGYEFFDKTPIELVCLKNGILNLNTKELTEFTPDIPFLNKIPVDFDPVAKCPLILKTLRQWLENEDYVKTVLEFIGYCLKREYIYHKAIFLVGEGGNGKSTLLNLIINFIGEQNVSHVPVQDLDSNFKTVLLYAKLVNLADELSTRSLDDSNKFKILTGESVVAGNIKFVQNPINFRNYAKLIFSTNQLPVTKDLSYAFFRRPLIIRFNKIFSKENGLIDERLIEKLSTPVELGGLLNLALEGLERLYSTGEFSVRTDSYKTQEEWSLDLVSEFASAKIRPAPDSEISFPDLYKAFVEFCKVKEQKPLAEIAFSLRLKRIIEYRKYYKQEKGKGRHWVYQGIRFADSESDENMSGWIDNDKI